MRVGNRLTMKPAEGDDMEEKLTLVQSMKVDRFEDPMVLGSQYSDESDNLIWHFAVWSETNTCSEALPR